MELTIDRVKDFAFDVLGDFVVPDKDLEISQTKRGFQVIVLRTRGIPKEAIQTTWLYNVKQQPEFSDVKLFI